MNETSRFVTPATPPKSLREWVDAQPRTITQVEIARFLGISTPALSGYIATDARPCGREVALRLHHLTGVPLAALLDPHGKFAPTRAAGAA